MNKSKSVNAPVSKVPVPQQPHLPADLDELEKECSDEEDFELLIGFDPESARNRLFTMNNSIRLPINHEQQRDMNIEVGVNVSHENPWKQISKRFLEDHLSTDTYEMKVLKEKLQEIEDDPLLLIGYVPHLSDEIRDTFIIYLDEITCKEASEIVKRLEAVERRKITKSIIKYPRPYTSMGSEYEVDLYVKTKRTNLVDIELQSVYPMRHSEANFQLRLADDVRDGYAELLPDKKIRFKNVYRKMVDRSIQSGEIKISEEQQTIPTFPTNAWSQYLYDMEEEIKKSREAETETIEKKEDEDVPLMLSRRKKSKEEPPKPEMEIPEEPKVSKQVEELLDVLEFNQVDMYRNDYPSIAKAEILKYQTPYLEEVCCFANIAKCKGRYITSMDWHPEFSGLCVVSYGFNLRTKTINDDEDDEDYVQRTIMESNPVLVWSFDDPLHPKLELEAVREISCISFCPYDGNIIIGGTINGQIIIWDIRGRLQKIEAEEMLTPDQLTNREEIRAFLNWSKFDESNKLVLPAAISSIEKSHENAITTIKWMARNYQCTTKGLLKEDREHGTMYRQFVTASLDGNICFWDLDWKPDTAELAKLIKLNHKVTLPDELKTESSPFKVVDQLFCPHYKLTLSRPITGITFNEGDFRYDPTTKPDKDITKRIQHKITPIRKECFNPKMVVGTTVGELWLCSWESSDFSQGAIVTPQTMVQESFAYVHDGPITHVHRNPFLHNVVISLGGSIFALWHDDLKEFPIFWRRREGRLTGFQWSLDRPSVFFLICENGSLEIWDLTTRIDIPSMIESLGGNILTEILQHKLTLSKRLLAIGDFNTNLRIFIIPSAFVHPMTNEKETFGKYITDEVKRKRDQEQWKRDWYESNKDIVDAKKVAEQEMNDEMEQKEKMRKEIEEKRAQMAEAEAKKRAQKNAKKMTYDLPERLERKWEEQNYKRLLKVMMERKKVDKELLEKQTKILKDRMHFNERKKVAIKESFAQIEQDLSAIRARLIPVEEYQATREELVSESVDEILQNRPDYKSIEAEAMEQIKNLPEMIPMTLPEIIKRCKTNREILNQSMGGGAKAKFERFRLERQQQKMSRYSSISHIPGTRSVTFSTEPKDGHEA